MSCFSCGSGGSVQYNYVRPEIINPDCFIERQTIQDLYDLYANLKATANYTEQTEKDVIIKLGKLKSMLNIQNYCLYEI